MKEDIQILLSNPVIACSALFLVSALTFVAALGAEYALNLEPCVLCVYQRWPYVITALLGFIGLGSLYKEEWVNYSAILIFIAAVTFFAGGLIAFYHVGVEQHWWKSGLEGCAVQFETGSMEELRAMFDNKIIPRCDEVAWSFLGISMAGYNMVLSFILAFASGWSAVLIRRRIQEGLL